MLHPRTEVVAACVRTLDGPWMVVFDLPTRPVASWPDFVSPGTRLPVEPDGHNRLKILGMPEAEGEGV